MATDFRIMCGFFSHPKTLKLFARHGSDGVVALQILWEWATQWRPKGILYDMTDEDILLACRMSTAPEEKQRSFVADLVDIRWLDVADDGTMVLHNWEERQPWVFKEEERKEQARANAQAGWEKRKAEKKAVRKKPSKTPRKQVEQGGGGGEERPATPESMGGDANADADGNAPLLSLPSPSKEKDMSGRAAPELAAFLWGRIKANHPSTKPPKLENWAREIERMIRLDERDPEDIRVVIEWSQRDGFWSGTILGAESLRKHFDKLLAQMARAAKADEGQRPSPEETKGMTEEEFARLKGNKP